MILGSLLLSALAAGPAPAFPERRGPLEVRDEELFAQPRLSLPATSPDPLAPGETRLRLDLDWGSDFGLRGRDPDPLFIVDGEHRTLAVDVRRGVSRRVTLGLRVPLRWRGPGVLDGVIDWWHRITGLPDNDRPLFPTDRFRLEARDDDFRSLVVDERTGYGLGAIEASALWSLRAKGDGLAAALIGRVALPTGTGAWRDAGTGFGLQAVGAVPLGRTVDVFFGAGGTVGTADQRGGLDYRRGRLHGFATLEWRAARPLSLLIETAASSQLVTNVQEFPDWQMYLRIGTRFDLGERWRVQAGFVEGIVTIQSTTDFGVQAGVSRRF